MSTRKTSANLLPVLRFGLNVQFKAYSKEEEYEIWLRGEYGKLVENVAPMIWRYTPKYCNPEQVEDVFGATMLHLLERSHKWDHERGRYSTWATWQLRHVSNHYRRKDRMVYIPQYPVGYIPQREALTEEIKEKITVPEIWEPGTCEQQMLEVELKKLDARTIKILLLVAEGYNNVQIGALVGLTKQRVKQIRDRAIRKLQEALCRE